ncbi:hypothetical protein KDH_67550 [Dictyobacter sp. S3.2.2.5]|uniref:Uncharacterized protein n=1 Tax=Dictyobacter halimunensis TaxID=3026934 RepID=A0ABQ6G0B6_9CHLR|nr:hypothetical protein KDH_67550 [Dictyobacter sp. S3.2.2.5]
MESEQLFGWHEEGKSWACPSMREHVQLFRERVLARYEAAPSSKAIWIEGAQIQVEGGDVPLYLFGYDVPD